MYKIVSTLWGSGGVMTKGPIYQKEDVVANLDLLKQLYEAVDNLERAMIANKTINKGNYSGTRVGYGVWCRQSTTQYSC